ncbi:MAG TPA: hypothetical protein VHI95_04970 [Acidimicrobiales bacterium]|nr:hypothetical protein [Acidimicrobiales bacterium]
MLRGVRFRLFVCLVAGLAAVGLHAYGDGGGNALRALRLPEPQHVLAPHADSLVGTVATRAETLSRDAAKRPVLWFGSLFALGPCALALLAAGHHRRGIVLATATLPASVHLSSTSPRAPPPHLS